MTEDVSQKIENFFSSYRVRSYPKGQILIMNDDMPRDIFYIVSGKVKQYDVTYRGDEIIVNVFKSPAFFPMSLAINKGSNPYIYEAESAVDVRQAPIEDVLNFVQSNPDVMFDLLSRIYRGVDALIGRMVHLMASSAKSRLMYELFLEAQRFGVKKENGAVEIQLNEKELGARAGLSRETVSREIQKLKEAGQITFDGKKICIGDINEFGKLLKQST